MQQTTRPHEHGVISNRLRAWNASTASVHSETSYAYQDILCTQEQSLQSGSRHTEAESNAPNFDCSICLDVCYAPVVTLCGHLFCWPCLYHWLSVHSLSNECPVCKASVQKGVVPLYGRGKVACSEFLAERFPGMLIPCRPSLASTYSGSEFSDAAAVRRDHHLVSPSPSVLGYFCEVLLHAFVSLLPPSSCISRLLGMSTLAGRRRRYNNEKEFVLNWSFIVVSLLTTLGFLLC